jgi:hypothetical protein
MKPDQKAAGTREKFITPPTIISWKSQGSLRAEFNCPPSGKEECIWIK